MIRGQLGQGVSGLLAFRRLGQDFQLRDRLRPWRIEVPTQSLPVSPPPMTITCLPLADEGRRARR